MAKAPKKVGRPSKRTPQIEAEIVERLSKGEPLAQICRDERMPDPATVWRWQDEDAQLSQAIARAREIGFDVIALDCLHIADETGNDTILSETVGGIAQERPNAEWISRSKLRVDTRLKLLAKWDPKRYGDKQLIGSDPENPLPAGFTVNLVRGEKVE